MSLGEVWLEEPYWGWWARDDFPAEIVIRGRLFKKARFRQPYDGVIEQYREVEHFFNDHPAGKFIMGAATVTAISLVVAGFAAALKST